MTADDKGLILILFLAYLITSWFSFGSYWVNQHKRMKANNRNSRLIWLSPPHDSVDFVAMWIAAALCTIFWPFLLGGKLFSIWWKSRR